MIKTTKKGIKSLVKSRAAVDLTRASFEAIDRIIKEDAPEQIGFAVGTYGRSAALYRGRVTGTLYAVTERTTALFQLG